MKIESEGFKIEKDGFSGYTLDTKKQDFTSTDEYHEKLKVALLRWQEEGVRGFWAKIRLEHSHLTAVFAKYGLDFHHAQPGYVIMSKWLPTTEPDMIPEYANQYLGVAGFVVNEHNQLLVIQEKYHPGTQSPKWKLPGGHAYKGEEIADAARREVREETGIEVEFVGVISFRHQLHYRYNCSDFYFICLMRPARTGQEINKCDIEIKDCKWIDLEEYVKDPDITDANRFFTQCYLDGVVKGNMVIGATTVSSYNRKTQHQVFSIQTIK
ncbi:uncharacterized protein LOC128232684 [Mya arenaria]|uniref:uncharacterized protein LOC128232684 n=1 Tax=Mya arenaria TaxID=6604 RepID=UPI0022DF8DE0|nr:uncharacterized protein LOC128232684 [Mya arenaria]XP_052802344.1 uncharacterized protein LOC128232684 [Mya arenaria]